MLIANAQQTTAALDWNELVDALNQGFIDGCEVPHRHQHDILIPNELSASLLLMPAWQSGHHLGIKLATVVPENGKRGLSCVNASYQLFDAVSGELLALIDGMSLTNRRTAAASALAARFLAKQNASTLTIIGNGGLARALVAAHCAVRPISQVQIWGRTPEHAERMSTELNQQGYPCAVVQDLEYAVRNADIVSSATTSTEPIIRGDWLSHGCHVDLVGAFKADMRESDDKVMQKADIYVDTRQGALSEAGDVIQAINSGAISEHDIVDDFYALCSNSLQTPYVRRSDSQITVFKSVGTALEDLTAAQLVYRKITDTTVRAT